MELTPKLSTSSGSIVPRSGDALVDIEVSVISGRGLRNRHRFRRDPSFSIELTLDNESKSTNVEHSKDDAATWNAVFVFSTTVTSSLTTRLHCKHLHFREDHVVGEASFKILDADRNKEIEIELCHFGEPTGESSSSSTFLTLRLQVALSVKFNVGRDTDVDLRSASCLKQMERMVGSISSENFKELSPAWIRLFNSLDSFSSLAQKVASLDSRAKVALGAMAYAIKVLVDQIKRDERIDSLARIMCELYAYVNDGCTVQKIVSFEKTLQRLLTQTAECAYFITDYQRISVFTQRAIVNMISNADVMISNFEVAFGELKIALILGSSLQTNLVSYRILQTVEHIENIIRIDRLPILEDVGWNSEKTCLRGTRETTINDVLRWAFGDMMSSSCVYLLSGPIACGKSAIAHSIAKLFHEQSRLGAAIFLHGRGLEPNAKRISSTIIHQLAGYDAGLHTRIAAKIKADQSLTWADVGRQFRTLVVDTTDSTDNKIMMIGPILIVIDGLDSIVDEEQHIVLTTIAEHSESLPANFRILITCRNDNIVADEILGHRINNMHVIGFDDTEGSNAVGISQHISQSLTDLFSKNPHLSTQYRLDELQSQFESRARGMHFWVSTIHRSLLASDNNDAPRLFDLLLSNRLPLSNNEAMDQLYHTLFKVFFRIEFGTRRLFDALIQSQRPMTLKHLRRVARFPFKSSKESTIADTAQKIGLIVEMDQDEQGVPLFGAHPSFEDFLTSAHRCRGTGLYVDRETPCPGDSAAAICVDIMNQSLRYNICNIEDVMTMNSEIADKDSRVEQYIPKSLQYACCNWALHLGGKDWLDQERTLSQNLQNFVSNHVLHWIEVMTLLGRFDDIQPTLFRLFCWMQERDVDRSGNLYVLTVDAIHFVKTCSSIISKAALQTYISALPLIPSNALLSKLSHQRVMGISRSTFNIKLDWNVKSLSLRYIPMIYSCANNGTLVAQGSRIGRISLIDVRTGNYLECNITIQDKIEVLTLSPDGTQLAAVTVNGQVAVHDVQTGTLVHSFKQNITGAAFITYSNSGTTILVVGKRDIHTFDCYVCNALTGKSRLVIEAVTMIYGPQSGIALSPNGRKLAVSGVMGIRIFDTGNGMVIDALARSHQLYWKEFLPCLIAWSPDAAFMAIALPGESAIRVWSFRDRNGWTIRMRVFHAHSASSYALKFSPDSSRIAFAWSYTNNHNDRNNSILRVQIWDTKTAKQVGEKEINENYVYESGIQLMFLPDAQEIIILSDGGGQLPAYLLSDPSPSYMTDPPKFHDFKSVPTLIIPFPKEKTNFEYASAVDADGWIVNSDGRRLALVPYPNFDISVSLPRSSTSTTLEIRHPESKKTVLKYVFQSEKKTSRNLQSSSIIKGV